MKGIVLAGGSGTRLYPLTKTVSKQMLPIYDKPMIYYPLSILLLAGIKDILIISTPRDIHYYEDLLGDGSRIGIALSYGVQQEPKGIADAFIVGKDFIGHDDVALILGDNIFYGNPLEDILVKSVEENVGATVFGYKVADPTRFGVVAFDEDGQVTSLEEKPEKPKSNYAVTGLYFYDNRAVFMAEHNIEPSKRNELEITDINTCYLEQNQLKVSLLDNRIKWLDTGTYDGLLEAGKFVAATQKKEQSIIACIEEIAFNKGYISKEELSIIAQSMEKTNYGLYLKKVIERLS